MKLSVLKKILDGTGKYLMVFTTKAFQSDGFTVMSCSTPFLRESRDRTFINKCNNITG